MEKARCSSERLVGPRVNRSRRTILFRYMALPGPPEIARPPSKMVVACTCNENRGCASENWPCECISVRSLHQIVTNHPTGLSFSSVCFSRMIPERATAARSGFAPDLASLSAHAVLFPTSSAFQSRTPGLSFDNVAITSESERRVEIYPRETRGSG